MRLLGLQMCLICSNEAWESELVSLWPSIIEVVNITEANFGPEADSFSDRIADEAIRKWAEFRDTSGVPADRVNDAFFKYQHSLYESTHGPRARRNGSLERDAHVNVTWPELEALPEYQTLRRYIEKFGRRYLSRLLYASEDEGFNIFSWAAVHSFSDFHGPHTHTGELLVGVFYARVNEHSGRLRLFDPRGQIVPFGKKYDFSCTTGQMILFPSWLQHAALATRDTDYRVVFAFNIGVAGHGDYKSMHWGRDPVSGYFSTVMVPINFSLQEKFVEKSRANNFTVETRSNINESICYPKYH